MKIATYRIGDATTYGAVKGATVSDFGKVLGPRAPTLKAAIASGELRQAALEHAPQHALRDVVMLPPIPNPEKIICIGLNYRKHAEEAKLAVPEFPSLFLRLTNTLVPDGGTLTLPRVSSQFDFEGELALIIGKGGRHIAKDRALEHVFGYACFNDASVRDYQFKHCLAVGKNFAATGGFGPWIATADEIPRPEALTLVTRLNGAEVQRSPVADLIFDIPYLIAYVSTFTELVPGDVIATGTPAGVGWKRTPPV